VVQHLQHLSLTSESDAELVNNPLQRGLSMPARVAWRIFAKTAGAALEARSRDETQRIATNIAKLPEQLKRPQYCLSVAQFVGRRKRPARRVEVVLIPLPEAAPTPDAALDPLAALVPEVELDPPDP
jgi:hypothetical protein